MQEAGSPVERRSGLIEEARIRLEDVRDARGDIERDRDIGDGGPCGEPERVAQEDLVGTDLDEQRGQFPEIGEDRADLGVRGVGPAT